MLTPPLFKKPIFPRQQQDLPGFTDQDDDFFQSPFRSTPVMHPFKPPPSHSKHHPPPPPSDDFGSPSTSRTPAFFPSSDSQPLRTPVKQVHRASSRPALSNRQMNAPATVAGKGIVTATGTKRKSTTFSTPLRQQTVKQTVTPLSIQSSSKVVDSKTGSVFDRLAPLPPPRFSRSPETRAETDKRVKGSASSFNQLSIDDLERSREGIDVAGLDDADKSGQMKPVDKENLNRALGKQLMAALAGKPKVDGEEVVEDMSPDGHINKRRAKTRPLSDEFLAAVKATPSPMVSLFWTDG